jgi:hypothetical protein
LRLIIASVTSFAGAQTARATLAGETKVRYKEKGLGLRASLLLPIVAVAIMTAVAAPGMSGEDFGDYVKELNGRIESAVVAGREWPKYPGGLAGFLFGQDSVVGKGCIYFNAGEGGDHDDSRWREVTIAKISDGTWKVTSIRACGESDARELIERRDYLRQTTLARSGFDYASQGPLELLDLLKTLGSSYWEAPILPFGWVKESDLPALIELLDSVEPCANVQNMLSSFIDAKRSTIGNEAAYLIEGFRKDQYPPRLNSTRPFCDSEEIKKWWEERQGT